MGITTLVEIPYPSLSGNHHVKGNGRGVRYLSSEALAYRAAVKAAVGPIKAPAGHLRVQFVIAPPNGVPRDADNVMKPVKDALTNAGFWEDDSNLVIRQGSWEWTDPATPGRILVVAEAI